MATYTYREVLQRIEDITSLVDVTANEERLKRLIFKAALESMSAKSMLTKTAVEVEVVNGLAKKPCDLWRLLRVEPSYRNKLKDAYLDNTRSGEVMEPNHTFHYNGYDHTEEYIKPSWVRNGSIIIHYKALPTTVIEEDGDEVHSLTISESQLDYCAYESARIILRDEAARGKVNYQIYAEFAAEADGKLNVALSSTRKMSIDDMERATWMMRNGQFYNLR